METQRQFQSQGMWSKFPPGFPLPSFSVACFNGIWLCDAQLRTQSKSTGHKARARCKPRGSEPRAVNGLRAPGGGAHRTGPFFPTHSGHGALPTPAQSPRSTAVC